MPISAERREELWNLGMSSIQALEVERGILASGKEELYGCIFGRDSLLTSLLLLESYEKTRDAYVLALVRKVLINLAKLQGREHNPQSGEEPGKIIHEFRPDKHEHLTQNLEHAWYLYPDGIMRSYDTVDATPLFLIAVAEYQRLSNDAEIFELLEANIRDALRWILLNTKESVTGLLSYHIHPERTHGGLSVQSWMDSGESLFFEESQERPAYPIAPIEVQAYAYRALKVWGSILSEKHPEFSKNILTQADQLKEKFSEYFAHSFPYAFPFAIDGNGIPLSSMRSSVGQCLWAGWHDSKDGQEEGNENGGSFNFILRPEDIERVVDRLMQPDIFVPEAGIRTLSENSTRFEANSYHNGSIWPHDTALISLGFVRAGYKKEGLIIRDALLNAYSYFGTPLELFTYERESGLGEYRSASGQGACRVQAWSAAALLAIL